MLAKSLAAATASEPKVYVEDVFSTFLYTGTGAAQTITNGIVLADDFTITPGTALAGGYFAGFISQTGNGVATHALIVAPLATGATATGVAWKTTNTTTAGTTSSFDGAANSANMNNASHPAAEFCETLSIGGYTDWYLPARYELEIAYYNLKPTTTSNDTGFGANPYSVPARGSNYTAGTPAQTTVTAFQTGNSELFGATHWSSTEGSSTNAWALSFTTGEQSSAILKNTPFRIRAFRKIPITDPLLAPYLTVQGKGGLVWIKGRSGATGHRFTDTTRGATKSLESNSTAVEATETTGLTSFSSTGFALGADVDYNTSAATYCSWTFRKAAKFFDVVTYTGNGVSGRQIPHNLGSMPGIIIVKCTSASANWVVWHRSLSANRVLFLNNTAAEGAGTNSVTGYISASTSSDFTVSSGYSSALAGVNASGATYVAYLFAHDAGGFGTAGTDSVVSCGSASNGTFVNLGWEPQWLLLKSSLSNDNWYIYDTMRGLPVSGTTPYLLPNTSGAEANGTDNATITATGFTQNLGTTAIYMAIRRGPMKTPTSGTSVFSPNYFAGDNSTSRQLNSGFPADLFYGFRMIGDGPAFVDRLRGKDKQLHSPSTSAEATSFFYCRFDSNSGPIVGWNSSGININGSSWAYRSGAFRRAPGFFDVVAYTGTGGSSQVLTHNLTVTPQLTIFKKRSAVSPWDVVSGNTSYLLLNQNSAQSPDYSIAATATTITASLAAGNGLNASGATYIAYLFATCPGVSKVGTYTGTGTTKQIDCGFTAGARFVMIKRTDSTGDWYVWDTARGLISGNDPYLLLNSTAAENPSTDYIDPLSSGFEISSTAPAAINANGGTYIFLAIA